MGKFSNIRRRKSDDPTLALGDGRHPVLLVQIREEEYHPEDASFADPTYRFVLRFESKDGKGYREKSVWVSEYATYSVLRKKLDNAIEVIPGDRTFGEKEAYGLVRNSSLESPHKDIDDNAWVRFEIRDNCYEDELNKVAKLVGMVGEGFGAVIDYVNGNPVPCEIKVKRKRNDEVDVKLMVGFAGSKSGDAFDVTD